MIETQRLGTLFSKFPTRFDWPALPFGRAAGHSLHLNQSFAKLYTDRTESLSTERKHLGWYHAWPLTRSEYLFNCIHRLLDKHLTPKESVDILEVGCRSGEFCNTLIERGYRAFGVDLSHASLQEARRQVPNAEFERASFYESFRDVFLRQFDAIVFLHAVEHLHAPQRFIHQVAGSLAPGGLFVITARFLGNVISLPDMLTRHAGPLDFLQRIDGTIEDESPTTLGQLLANCGLEIVEFQGSSHLPAQWRAQLFVARKPG